eukprot:6200918-Pleurochrysis_carterae.AAC.2
MHMFAASAQRGCMLTCLRTLREVTGELALLLRIISAPARRSPLSVHAQKGGPTSCTPLLNAASGVQDAREGWRGRMSERRLESAARTEENRNMPLASV